MPLAISGVSIERDSTGAVVAWGSQKYVYAQPSRDDIQVSYDGGTTWSQWLGDPDLEGTAFEGCIRAAVGLANGAWTFSLPFTDTEVETQVDSSTPAVVWNIRDPNVVTGEKVYYGSTPSALGASRTLKYLLVDASDPWQIASASYTGYPYGTERLASVSFSAGQQLNSVTWADIGTDGWKATLSLRTDDTGVTGAQIVTGSETNIGCDVQLSAAPAAGKTAQVDLWVRP